MGNWIQSSSSEGTQKEEKEEKEESEKDGSRIKWKKNETLKLFKDDIFSFLHCWLNSFFKCIQPKGELSVLKKIARLAQVYTNRGIVGDSSFTTHSVNALLLYTKLIWGLEKEKITPKKEERKKDRKRFTHNSISHRYTYHENCMLYSVIWSGQEGLIMRVWTIITNWTMADGLKRQCVVGWCGECRELGEDCPRSCSVLTSKDKKKKTK